MKKALLTIFILLLVLAFTACDDVQIPDPGHTSAPTTQQTKCQHTHTQLLGQLAATCTQEGYSGDKKCADCGLLLEQGRVLAKIAHSPILSGAMEPTAGKDGYTGDKICSLCAALLEKGQIIERPDTVFEYPFYSAVFNGDRMYQRLLNGSGYAYGEFVFCVAFSDLVSNLKWEGDSESGGFEKEYISEAELRAWAEKIFVINDDVWSAVMDYVEWQGLYHEAYGGFRVEGWGAGGYERPDFAYDRVAYKNNGDDSFSAYYAVFRYADNSQSYACIRFHCDGLGTQTIRPGEDDCSFASKHDISSARILSVEIVDGIPDDATACTEYTISAPTLSCINGKLKIGGAEEASSFVLSYFYEDSEGGFAEGQLVLTNRTVAVDSLLELEDPAAAAAAAPIFIQIYAVDAAGNVSRTVYYCVTADMLT